MLYAKYIKRILDFILSFIAVVCLSPLLLILYCLVRVKLGAPVLFRQERPGRGGEIFTLCKFRTMTEKRDENGALLPDEERLTSFGKFLRSTSLDELPELFNILKGDMSLVGPRPLLVCYLPWYTEEESRRHDMRPGLTGLAQVNGRNALVWEERFAYDLEYVEHCTFFMDVQILMKTIGKVIKRSGILSGAEQTLENFDVYRRKQLEKED